MSEKAIQLGYARARQRRLSKRMLTIVLAPTVVATFCLVGIPHGLAKGGFHDEGPLEAALYGFLAMSFALIAGLLALGRSVPLLIWNACTFAAGIGGCLVAGRH